MSKKSKEMSGLPEAELSARISELRKELIKLKAQAKTTGMKNPTQIRETKKAIARAFTFINSRKEKGTKKVNKEKVTTARKSKEEKKKI